MSQSIRPPYSPFVDADGTLLQGGFIYIGEANANPETSPTAIYWDSALTIQASQPLQTLNGVITRNGTPANCYILGDFSMTVKNKHKETISSILSFATSGVIQSYASAGANSDITSLNALTTPLSAQQGGTQQFWAGIITGINTLVATTITPINGFSLTAGVRVSTIVAADNTGPATLNVNSSGDISISINGDAGLVALSGQEMQLGTEAIFEYNGTVWVLTNPFLQNTDIAFKGNNTHAGTETFTSKIIVSSGPLGAPGGRLTLTTGTPFLVNDTAGASTIYYTPDTHNMIQLYNGSGWETRFFTELSQAKTDTTKSPAATVANTAYDIFVWDDANTIRATRGPAWSISVGATATRGTGAGTTELIRQNGVLVNKNAITNGPAALRGVYVGSVITNSSNTYDWICNPAGAAGGGNARANLFNAYNKRFTTITSKEGTASWSYSTSTVRAANNSNNNRATFFKGLPDDSINANSICVSEWNGNGRSAIIGIGYDVTNAISGMPGIDRTNFGWNASITLTSSYSAAVAIGQHFAQMVEAATNGSFNNSGTGAPYTPTAGITLSTMM
jgi:hypothetical protein